jgi:pyruvate dehydrogenase E2 component (dihydrolipoamide acetyltransferase)
MSKDVIMPALGMAQETGTLIRWLKAPGESVAKGEPLMEIETDKATVEIEAPAAGVLANVTAQPGDVVPVGRPIALILAPGEPAQTQTVASTPVGTGRGGVTPPLRPAPTQTGASSHVETARWGVFSPSPPAPPPPTPPAPRVPASPLAARMAAEHGLDLAQIKPGGGKVQKEDVLAYLAAHQPAPSDESQPAPGNGRRLASPKARRLAQEGRLDLGALTGSGPEGAVLAADVVAASEETMAPGETPRWGVSTDVGIAAGAAEPLAMSRTWRVMVDRLSQAWSTIPHFYLLREVNATRFMAWRAEAQGRSSEKITYTDLLLKVVAAALRLHPRLNAAWQNDGILINPRVNVGLAVAIDDGLVVPVIHDADTLGLGQIAARRAELVARAQARKLSLDDLSGCTFTISNLGMYGVDAFIAIVNPPQAAILSAGRIAERVVPVNGQPAVAPMMTLGLSCDHRVVDGARAAQFLQTLAERLEAPLSLLD